MRRTAIAAVALAVVALGATGCSSSPEQVTASMTSPPRPEAPSELAPEDPFGELPDGFEDFGGSIDDMFEQFESALGVGGECLDLLMTYSELLASAFGGLPGAPDRASAVDELRAALPPDLHDELQVISDGIETMERDGFGGIGTLADPAFLEANDAIMSWLQTSCDAASTQGEGS